MLKKLAMAFGGVALATLAPTLSANAGCVAMEGSLVVNYCNYRVIGNFKGSDGSWGGFGPISPGSSEGTSKRPNAGWNVSYCNYDDWVRNTCRPTRAQDL